MGQASISLKVINSVSAESDAAPRPAGFFKVLLAALHHSRRLQAKSALKQYAHLFDKSGQSRDLTKWKDR